MQDQTSGEATPRTLSELTELLNGNVGEVTANLADCSAVELMMLAYLEKQEDGGGRSSLTKAIDKELDARAEAEVEARDQVIQTKIEEMAALTETAIAEKASEFEAQLAAVTAERDTAQANAQKAEADRDKAQGALLQLQKKKGGAQPPSEQAVEQRRIEVVAGDFAAAARIVFFDRDMNTVPGLPALGFEQSDFFERGAQRMLMAPISFDGTGPRVELGGAALLDGKRRAVSVTKFRVPLLVGGGTKAQLAKRSLSFLQPAE